MMSVTPKIFGILASVVLLATSANAAESPGLRDFNQNIKPLLENYCYDCHGDGMNKGDVAFDEFESVKAILADKELWLHALKNLRAGLMPPPKKPQPSAEEKERIVQWIKTSVFESDPQNPDPGRVTIRRLNRVEYQNTVRDLLGVNYDAQSVFPPDDAGHGFDNISDVLTLPPMLLEKYVMAANQIVTRAVPMSPKTSREETVDGTEFAGAANANPKPRHRRSEFPEPLALSYYKSATVSNRFDADVAGKYQLVVSLMINEWFVDGVFDYNKVRLIFRVDGRELLNKEYGWEGGKPFTYSLDVDWTKGAHTLAFELQPLTPDQPQARSLSMQITSVNVRGPLAPEHWVQPRNYKQFFPKPVPTEVKARRAYARELLGSFARRAFRRPPDEKTLNRLVSLAEDVYSQPGKNFETGVAQAMVAILASPRFLFREELPEKSTDGGAYPFVDEFSLASRLSYFLWSSMPDEELLRLAEAGELRKNLPSQLQRMLKDRRSDAFVRNFVGQWLRSRDIENIPLEPTFILARERKSGADLRIEMSGELRAAMRRETERCFDYILREDRSLLELLDADYTFLNERLATHYGITNVTGNEMRRVKLPADSPRGGILTQGTILGVTSNPTRTSPVKRGLFILDNILGTPPPPPPPDIPPLEDANKGLTNRTPSLRETLAAHREDALCSSCHNRMDPLGLAFENFNALGQWRTTEFGEPIDATGSLVTGESFSDVRELKRNLATHHQKDFYRTVTEKLLTYALGRGPEYYDVETCDQIVARIEAAEGRASALIAGVVESAPFQRTRATETSKSKKPERTVQRRADIGNTPTTFEHVHDVRQPLTRPSATLSPSDGERDGVRGSPVL